MRARADYRLWGCSSLILLGCLGACSDPAETTSSTSQSSSASSGGANAGGAGGAGGAPSPSVICEQLGLPISPRASGPFGETRGQLAADFSLPLLAGSSFDFDVRFSGCESYIFSVDRIPVSDLDSTSVWEKDLDDLLAASPQNTHYFFFSRQSTDEAAAASLSAMQARIESELSALPAEEAAHWRSRLHVVATRAQSLPGWIGSALNGHGRVGMAIDRFQRIRGGGTLADVKRFSSALNSQGLWPWRSNLAYLANEPNYLNAQYERFSAALAKPATEVVLFNGEVLEEFADTTITLPSASEMAGFDTFEVLVEQACPDETSPELGNCGAWDYLAHLYLTDSPSEPIELARFITSYHRETQWIVDVTPMMAHLLSGGSHDFKWEFAPPWNTQPTKTKLSLRFSNQGKGYAPRQAIPLFSGGDFNSSYNVGRPALDIAIPPTASHVALFALTTGHGADTAQCAEFCNHQHEFTVGGDVLLQQFEMAGTESGCIENLANGMVPNQGGTWWFGRGGWCPGQQVEPWVVDVTADAPAGQNVQVSYQGLLNGATPPDSAGNIVLSSYLVVYE